MKFSFSRPDFAKIFTLERKYTISIGNDDDDTDKTTLKVPVFEDGPLEAALYWRKQFEELASLKAWNANMKFTNALLLLSGDAKDKWEDARDDVLGDDDPTDIRFKNTMDLFISKCGATPDAAEDLREFLTNAKKPAGMSLQNFKRRLTELNRYLPYLPGPLNERLDDQVLFSTLKRCVRVWHESFIKSNARMMIATIDELVSYYEELEEQENKNNDRRSNNNNRNNTNRRNQNNRHNQYQRHQNRQNSNQNSQSNNNNRNQGNRGNSMWCEYHQTDTHDDRNCRAQRRNQNNNNNNNSSSGQRESGNGNQSRHRYNTRSQNRNNNNHTNGRREENHTHEENSSPANENSNSPSSRDDASTDDSMYTLTEIENPTASPAVDPNIDYIPELVLGIMTQVSQRKYKFLRALVDSGASRSILHAASLPKHMHSKIVDDEEGPITWDTKGGLYQTKHTAELWFQLSELAPSQHFKHKFKIDMSANKPTYDIILGRDLFKLLKLDLIWSADVPCIEFQDSRVKMKPRGFWKTNNIRDLFPSTTLEQAERDFEEKHRFTAASYTKADLQSCLPVHLTSQQKESLFNLLIKYESLFQGKLGRFPGAPITIKLKANAKPYHGRAFPVPKVYEHLLKNEVERLVKLGVLRKINNSEWAAPSFGIPKKNGEIRFVSDFRRLNRMIVRHPFPLPSIPETVRTIEGFTYCSTMDVNMGFWSLLLDEFSQRLCTIILPWGKYCYVRLPMGLSVSPDIYQERMASLFDDMPDVRVYIDDILLITKGTFENHLTRLQEVFRRLLYANLQINATKSSFCALETEYLGFVLTPHGIKPQVKRVQAILQIATPKNVKQVRSFIGMINHYKHMIPQRAHLVTPLANLTKKGSIFNWTSECESSFREIKRHLAKRIALAYPDFSKPFNVYTDASKYQLGSVISQDDKPIAFYSRKLTDAQTRYTVGELELLSIVETLREFRTILLGQRLNVYTDHKNLTFEKSATDRVQRWKLIIEEYGPNIVYVNGVKNIIADALSRLPIQDVPVDENYFFEECFITEDDFPLSFDVISEEQRNDHRLQAKVQSHDGYTQRMINNIPLVFHDDRIVVPASVQPHLLQWYHKNLMHPGITRMQQTILQHFTWANLRHDVESMVKMCRTCQHYKKQPKKYGKLPTKTQDDHVAPWTTVAVDTIGPWTIPQSSPRSKSDKVSLIALTIIDVHTCFMEIIALADAESATVAAAFDQNWLCRYPRPLRCIMDNGTEFTGIEFQELLQSYGIIPIRTTVRNPQANAILERTHQVIANMLRTSILMRYKVDTLQDRQAILTPVQWAMNSTYHTTLQATPGQLAFQRDMILPTSYLANWATIQARRQQQTLTDNIRENASRIPHNYQVGDQVLIRREVNYPYLGKLAKPTEGPFRIVDTSLLHINGTVIIARSAQNTERVNIRRLVPYFT